MKLKLVSQEAVDELLKESFDLNKQKMQVLDRICSIPEEDLCFFSEEARNKIRRARGMILKTRER